MSSGIKASSPIPIDNEVQRARFPATTSELLIREEIDAPDEFDEVYCTIPCLELKHVTNMIELIMSFKKENLRYRSSFVALLFDTPNI
jgi:hypothetical protein